ncbi:pyridoxal phosphate-dependent transferase [Cercophora scortea]|uniref:Pyridoxal phosphate-dependent transferase n=1 Tax=Cercophora scortea TaxID=314031 RepID=A0AAE0MHX6_9PEZI|nr:pyridoxal phosphate-dependent transferase [Cercophora scortea]
MLLRAIMVCTLFFVLDKNRFDCVCSVFTVINRHTYLHIPSPHHKPPLLLSSLFQTALKMGQLFSLSKPPAPPSPKTTLEEDEEVEEADPPTFTNTEPKKSSSSPSLSPDDSLPILAKAKGHYYHPLSGPRILDACGGAGVSCIGHGREDVARIAYAQMKTCAYASHAHFQTTAAPKLSAWLVDSTGGHMRKVYLLCSGSEAVEAALKLSREYFLWAGEPRRVNVIARWESYHGTTLGSLAASGHVVRREPFEPMLAPVFHKIPACNPYRQRLAGESDAEFVVRKTAELEDVFQRLGPDTVAAVILEPVVGAALGCAPAVPGYLQAVKAICEEHGALLIFDEVMCGMGRTGTLHAWQQEAVVPDLQTIAKGFAGGYQPASALLVGAKVVEAMEHAGKTFTHGQTYQDHPVVAATALKLQEIIQGGNLLGNVQVQGQLLERLLRAKLGGHPNVGDIRGRGLFWGVEFVRDKATKEPFDPGLQVAQQVYRAAMRDFKVLVYHGQGCAGDGKGDHIMIMPAYNVGSRLVVDMVQRVAGAVDAAFGTKRC